MTIRNEVDNNQVKRYRIKDGFLCKKVNGNALIVIPKLMQNSIIRQAYECGHFSPDKTKNLLMMDYWFKGMCKRIEDII